MWSDLSRFSAVVEGSGIEILAYVYGPIEKMLKAYITGQLADPQFASRGCWLCARNIFLSAPGKEASEQIAEHSLLRYALKDIEGGKCNQRG